MKLKILVNYWCISGLKGQRARDEGLRWMIVRPALYQEITDSDGLPKVVLVDNTIGFRPGNTQRARIDTMFRDPELPILISLKDVLTGDSASQFIPIS